jgi:hypothetical protein
MPGRRFLLPLVPVAAVVAAGCGSPSAYDLQKTRACLEEQQGVALDDRVDFVASNALGGAVTVKLLGNQVTLSFGEDRQEAERIVRAYQRFKGRNIGLPDVLRPSHNVVELWKAHPSDTALATIHDCLK